MHVSNYACLFIPSDTVRYPNLPTFPAFGGDNRGFAYDAGTSHAELEVTVQSHTCTPCLRGGMVGGGGDLSFQVPLGQLEISETTTKFGESSRYRPGDVEHVPGKPGWWAQRKSGVYAVERRTASVNSSNLNASIIQRDSGRCATTAVEVTRCLYLERPFYGAQAGVYCDSW